MVPRDALRERWTAAPPAARAFAGAVAGGAAALAYGIAWFHAYEIWMRPYSCDLGCVILIPLLVGLLVAGVLAGAWRASTVRPLTPAASAAGGVVAIGGLLHPPLFFPPILVERLLPAGEDLRTWFAALTIAMALYVLALLAAASILGVVWRAWRASVLTE